MRLAIAFGLTILLLGFALVLGEGEKKAKKKSILDFNEADVERIFQEWEDNDEDRDEDDDFFDPRKPPEPVPLDLEGLKSGRIDPQQLMKQSKKNKPMMVFVGVKAGEPPDQAFTEKVSGRWMQSLQNAHVPVQRYIVAPNRVMFYVQDGSLAWDIKEYIVTQTDCTIVTFEHQDFPCAGNEGAGQEGTGEGADEGGTEEETRESTDKKRSKTEL